MNNAVAKKAAKAKSGGLKKLLFDEFFIAEKTGIREGFRRLALLLGGGAFAWTYANASQVSEYTLQLSGVLGVGMTIAMGLVCVVAFFVVAAITKTVGWVIEGFVG